MTLSDKEARRFLDSYMSSRTPAGHEAEGQKIWLGYMSQFMNPETDFIETDSYGGVAAIIKGKKNNCKVVLDAHVDEVSWTVQRIEPDGRIGLARNGSPDFDAALGQRIFVHGDKDQLFTGVFERAAIHVRGDDDEKPSLKDTLVFIGAESEEQVLSRGIRIGSAVTVDAEMVTFGLDKKNKYIAGRALDDKICGYINTQIVRSLKEQNIILPYTLCVVNSVQEETNRMGATFMAEKLRPDAAFALDVTFDTASGNYDQNSFGHMVMNAGPALCVGAPMHPKLNDLVREVAEKSGVPLQFEPLDQGEHSGTNADSYFASGAPTTLLSLPIKNMHTPNETASWQDIHSTILLMTETLKAITGERSQFDPHADQRAGWSSKFKNQPKF